MERVGATPWARARHRAASSWLLFAVTGLLLGCLTAGCADEVPPNARSGVEAPAALATPSFLHDAAALSRALGLLTEPLNKPIRALSLHIYADRILLQAQDPLDPAKVEQYRFKAGELLGPIPVRLTGPGELKDNLFPLQYADLDVIVRLVKQAERRAGLGQARAVELSLKRNLPASMDIRFQVRVTSPAGARQIEARKDGKILAVRQEP